IKNKRNLFVFRTRGVPGALALLIAAMLVMPIPTSLAATWSWTGGGGNNNWKSTANWTPASRPTSANTTILNFGSNTRSTANNNIGGTFTLNQLNFANTLTGTFAVTGNALSFAGTTPQLNMNSNFAASISNAIALANDTTFSGTGSGTLTLSGVISGAAANTAMFAGGNYVLSNAANSFSGGFSQTGGVVTAGPTAANTAITIGNTGNSYLGAGTITITGGTLNLTPTGTGALTLNRSTMNAGSAITLNNGATATLTAATRNFTATPTYTFGTGGGLLSFAIQSGLSDAGGIGNIVNNATGTNQGIVQNTVYNNDATAGGWASTFNNTSPYMTILGGSISGTGNLEMSAINGALVYYGQTSYGGALTFSGVAGGNAEANSTATNVGRFALAAGTFTATGGIFFQNATQVLTFGGPSTLGSNITILSGETDFSGRDTSVVYPPTANRLTVGGGTVNSNTLTINNGATATFDLGFRNDSYAVA
ncbi:MAG: hypothetical protein B7X06_04570, partial [Verrucomicrobia bacterium 21-51-4]